MTKHTGERADDGMGLAAFRALLERHGARPERWPESVRGAAETLVAGSADARAMVRDAAALDAALDAWAVPPPSPELRRTVLAAAPRPQAPARRKAGLLAELLAALGGWRPASVAFAAALVLGVASGGVLFDDPTGGIGADIVQLALFDDSFAGY